MAEEEEKDYSAVIQSLVDELDPTFEKALDDFIEKHYIDKESARDSMIAAHLVLCNHMGYVEASLFALGLNAAELMDNRNKVIRERIKDALVEMKKLKTMMDMTFNQKETPQA